MLFDTAVNKLLKKQKILNEYANSEKRRATATTKCPQKNTHI